MTAPPHARRSLRKASLLLLIALAAACGGTYLGYQRVEQWYRRTRADRLAIAALQSPDGGAQAAVERLPALGTVGIERLAWLAAEPRADLAQPARQELDQRLESWLVAWRETGDPGQLTEPLVQAVRVLRSRVDQFAAGDVHWCESFALLSLELSEALPPTEATALIADCETILATLPRRRAQPRTADPALSTAASQLRTPTIDMQRLSVAAPAPPPSLPRGNATAVATPQPSVQNWSAPQRPSVSQPATQAGEPPRVSVVDIDEESLARSLPVAVNSASPPSPVATGPSRAPAAERLIALPTPLEVRDQSRILREAPTNILLRELPQANPYQAAAIRRELADRGVRLDEVLPTAEPVDSASRGPASLAERLAQAPPEQARRMLRTLAESGDAAVRLEALTLLATMGDPQLAEIARRRAVHDDDSRVAARATEILNGARR